MDVTKNTISLALNRLGDNPKLCTKRKVKLMLSVMSFGIKFLKKFQWNKKRVDVKKLKTRIKLAEEFIQNIKPALNNSDINELKKHFTILAKEIDPSTPMDITKTNIDSIIKKYQIPQGFANPLRKFVVAPSMAAAMLIIKTGNETIKPGSIKPGSIKPGSIKPGSIKPPPQGEWPSCLTFAMLACASILMLVFAFDKRSQGEKGQFWWLTGGSIFLMMLAILSVVYERI